MARFKLTVNGSRKYSPKEEVLFDLLSDTNIYRRVNTNQLAAKMLPDSLDGRVNIMGTIKRLSDKIDMNEEKFVIKKTPAAGPRVMEFWLEKRPEKRERRSA